MEGWEQGKIPVGGPQPVSERRAKRDIISHVRLAAASCNW